MASIEQASRRRVKQIQFDSRGIAMNPKGLTYDAKQVLSITEHELHDRGEQL